MKNIDKKTTLTSLKHNLEVLKEQSEFIHDSDNMALFQGTETTYKQQCQRYRRNYQRIETTLNKFESLHGKAPELTAQLAKLNPQRLGLKY
ncbi:MAG: hypothetical protein JSR97_11920 [Verrucomicrobia bacterium]|nr:hypothetical protein [Verrucomicrobiota bacterium]